MLALLLQDLGVDRPRVETLISEAAGLKARWLQLDKADDPAEVAALVTINQTIDEEVLERFPNLRGIAVAFTGFDCVDLEICARRGLSVHNAAGYATAATAELAVGLALALLREIPCAEAQLRSGGWDYAPGRELAGKTVGIVGTGAIGLSAAERFAAFGTRLVGVSRREKSRFLALGGRYLPLDDLLANSDVVSLHLPLNEETRFLLDAARISRIKPGAILINTARGGLIDPEALAHALESGDLAGAALDVFETEPLPADHPLRQAPRTILTPHIAYKSREALVRRAAITARNLAEILSGGRENRVFPRNA